jgi:peptidoglycan hydrolase-like protein with peptidoglycan-binding domain
MRQVCPNLSSIGFCMALAVGSIAVVSAPAWAAEDRVQTNASGQALSQASTTIVQRALARHNEYHGKVDGVWGKGTEEALRRFQKNNNLDVTGRVDEPTAQKLDVKLAELEPGDRAAPATAANPPASASDDARTSVQLTALSKDQAKEMQQRLQLLGYYKGPIDGDVGVGTRTALRNFFEHQADLASKGNVSNAAISLFGTEPNQIQHVSGSDKR